MRQIQVAPAIAEVSQSLLEIIKTAKASLSDGWDYGDVPALVSTAISELPDIFESASDLADEIKADVPGAVMAAGLFLGDVAEVFLSDE